jgi:DNA-binding MarR family transcriptional regulator
VPASDPPPEDLKTLLRECQRELTAHVHESLVAAGYTDLRPAHADALQFVDHEQGSRIQEMARRARVSWQSMAELVADLERLGYLARTPDPTDRRARRIRLTERGQALTPIAVRAMAEVEARWAKLVGREELDRLRAALRRIRAADATGPR